jgi:hypothetical protein
MSQFKGTGYYIITNKGLIQIRFKTFKVTFTIDSKIGISNRTGSPKYEFINEIDDALKTNISNCEVIYRSTNAEYLPQEKYTFNFKKSGKIVATIYAYHEKIFETNIERRTAFTITG